MAVGYWGAPVGIGVGVDCMKKLLAEFECSRKKKMFHLNHFQQCLCFQEGNSLMRSYLSHGLFGISHGMDYLSNVWDLTSHMCQDTPQKRLHKHNLMGLATMSSSGGFEHALHEFTAIFSSYSSCVPSSAWNSIYACQFSFQTRI